MNLGKLQVVDDELPETEHDFSVDVIVTSDEVIEYGPPRRPTEIVLKHLTQEKIAAIPVLAGLGNVFEKLIDGRRLDGVEDVRTSTVDRWCRSSLLRIVGRWHRSDVAPE